MLEEANSRNSLNHLVGAGQQRWRHFEAERFRGLEVDHQLVLGWRLHRQIGGLGAFEDFVDVHGSLAKKVSRPCMMLGVRISRIKRGAFGRLATRRFSPKLSVPIRLTPALSPHRAG